MQAFEIEEPMQQEKSLQPIRASESIKRLLPQKTKPELSSEDENYWLKSIRVATQTWFAGGRGLFVSVVTFFVVMILIILIRPHVWKPSKYHYAEKQIKALSILDYPPDFDQLQGVGKSGEIYAVAGNNNFTIKISSVSNCKKMQPEKEFYEDCLLANKIYHRIPKMSKRCYGIGTAKVNRKYKQFRVDDATRGTSLEKYVPKSMRNPEEMHVSTALQILEQVCRTVTELMEEDEYGDKYFHHDLHPKNIWVDKQKDGLNIMYTGFGSPSYQPTTEEEVEDAKRLTYRWFGYDLLWTLASDDFKELKRDSKYPEIGGDILRWFTPAFQDFFLHREDRHQNSNSFKNELTPDSIAADSKCHHFWTRMLSKVYRNQWTDNDLAKAAMNKLLGIVFYGVAMATDADKLFKPNFKEILLALQELRSLAKQA